MSLDVEFFIVRQTPALMWDGGGVSLSAFVLQRSLDALLEPVWRVLADLPRSDALALQGRLEGLTAVALANLDPERPTRLVLEPDPALAQLFERAHWSKHLVLRGGALGPEVYPEAIDPARYRLRELKLGHDWG